jgi:hypothetical protein
MSLYVIGLIVDDTRAIDKLYLTGFRLADIPSELITDVSIAEARELFFANDGIVNLDDSQLSDYLEEYKGSTNDYIEVGEFEFLYFDYGTSQLYTNFDYCIINKDGKHFGEDGIALFLSEDFGFNLGYRASCNKIMHLYSTSPNDDEFLDLDSELKDLIDLPTTSADCSDSDIYNTYNDLVKYKHTVGAVSTFFGVCEVFGLDEKLLMMPKDCNILHINLGSISNGMSIVFSPYIQKFYIDQFSLRHNSSGVLELDFCFSSSTANNIVDSIVNTIKDAVSYCNRSGKINIDLRLNLKYY